MATVYPKTSLSIKGIDTNNKSKTFSIGYVNPEAGDGNLKLLARKITNLTNLALDDVTKTIQTDIMDASTDTTVSGIILASTSDFFSNDTETYAAVSATLDQSTNPNIKIYYQTDPTTYSLSVQYNYLRSASNFTNFVGAVNAAGYSSNVYQYVFNAVPTTVGTNNAIHFQEVKDCISIRIGADPNAYSESAAAAVNIWVESVWEGLVRVPGYNYSLETGSQSTPIKTIYITKA